MALDDSIKEIKNMNIDKINKELTKTYEQLEELQKRAEELEDQKRDAENMAYIKIIRKNGISAEDLQLLIQIQKEENKEILKNKETETVLHEENV